MLVCNESTFNTFKLTIIWFNNQNMYPEYEALKIAEIIVKGFINQSLHRIVKGLIQVKYDSFAIWTI